MTDQPTTKPNVPPKPTISDITDDLSKLKLKAASADGVATREFAMFKTKLDEAYQWLRAHVEAL